MSKILPPLPTFDEWQKIIYPAEPGTQTSSLEQFVQAYTIAAIEAQGVPDGWRELMSEALDNALASTAEEGISHDRRNYRRELAQRIKQALNASAPPAPQEEQTANFWDDAYDDAKAAIVQQEPIGSAMTAQRAAYFMERFKHEEKLLGPNEQAALDFVLSMLSAPQEKQPLTDEQKQYISNETGAGHSLICLVESYINEIKGE